MSNSNSVSVSATSDKQTFAIKNPKTEKIIAFINFGNEVDADTANALSEDEFTAIIAKCKIAKFTKSTKGSALDGLV